MKIFFPLLLCLMAPVLAEPSPSRLAPQEIPLVPKTEKELKAWLEGTKWYTEDSGRIPLIFRSGRFETPLNKGSYSVDKPRVLVLNWGKGVKIRCVLDEQCTKLTELDGEKHVFLFDGRIPPEERKSKLNPEGQ